MTGPPLLELADITKSFGRVIVATDLSLSLPEGEALGIVGPNGAGKTSLFGIISGDLRPDAGDVRLAGRSISRLDSAERCRLGIGRTYQIPRPFEQMSVFENVLVAAQQGAGLKRKQAYDSASRALEETGVARLANIPAGNLGLLQRKRLEFARALATRPRLLLLDEVAGGLTDPEVHELVDVVQAARSAYGISVIWIEHVVRALLNTVDRLICLSAGQIIGDGTPIDVLSMPAVKEVFLGVTADGEDDAVLGAAVLGLPPLPTGGGR
jgi:branched-chain amino acid transport system ATP-binding protein